MNKRALRSFVVFSKMKLMKELENFGKLIQKHIDFHFALALVAIFGTTASLYLQFSQADLDFDTLTSSIYSVVHSRDQDLRENISLNYQLDQLEKEFDQLDVNMNDATPSQ